MHMAAAILAALYQRTRTGRGQRVEVAMQDSVLNLCRVKMRDQQRLKHGPLTEYPNESFGDEVPRSGNASGGGQPGAALRCKPGGPNDYCYVIIQPQIWPALARTIGRSELADDPAYATAEARIKHLDEVFGAIEQWTMQHTKHEVMHVLMDADVPCGPILSMKDLIEDPALARRGMIADVEHPQRGTFKTVGCPLVLSDSPVEIASSPLLGEHTADILREVMGCDDAELQQLRAEGVI
jgi:formyl-CoA transferase